MTPPYDVINEAERAAYMARSPYNMIHLILGAEYAEDAVRTIGFPGRRGCCRSGDPASSSQSPSQRSISTSKNFPCMVCHVTYRRH